jgi:hypothetical protein
MCYLQPVGRDKERISAMIKLEVTVTGVDYEDLVLALDDILRRIDDGDVEGNDFNGAGDYAFTVTEIPYQSATRRLQ